MMYADKDYILDIRHRLHEYPEIGFELPKTIALVKQRCNETMNGNISMGDSVHVGI